MGINRKFAIFESRDIASFPVKPVARLLAVCFSLVIGGGYEVRRFGKRGMGRDTRPTPFAFAMTKRSS